MDVLEKLKEDVREGRIDANRLIDILDSTQRHLHATQQQLEAANQRIAELEKQIGSPTTKLDQPYSTKAEEKRQQQRGKTKPSKRKSRKRRGRVSTADKIAKAKERRAVYPEGVPHDRCYLSHTRVIWELEAGRAVLIAYDVYRGPNNQYGKIKGAFGRSEFSLEIVLALAQLVYVYDIPFRTACDILKFFQHLHLSPAQANHLFRQLARRLSDDFNILCKLVANSAVVHADETGWSINSVWAFLSECARLLIFGVHKDADTLKEILDPDKFLGILISDDAAVYANFTQAQKCWAHLLRKAIKLTLLAPDSKEYREFTDKLLALYRKACRVQKDGRLSDAGRARKVIELDEELMALCWPTWIKNLPPQEGVVGDFRLLVNELMRLWENDELFTFVLAKPVQQPNGETKPVSGTNNEAERTLRDPAKRRKTGQTNKTASGAKRQSILTSILESLRLYLPTYTLSSVIEEIQRWTEVGQSCFAERLAKMGLEAPEESILDKIIKVPEKAIAVPDG